MIEANRLIVYTDCCTRTTRWTLLMCFWRLVWLWVCLLWKKEDWRWLSPYFFLSFNFNPHAHDVRTTLYWRCYDIETLKRRSYNVVLTFCTGWEDRNPLSKTLIRTETVGNEIFSFIWTKEMLNVKGKILRKTKRILSVPFLSVGKRWVSTFILILSIFIH